MKARRGYLLLIEVSLLIGVVATWLTSWAITLEAQTPANGESAERLWASPPRADEGWPAKTKGTWVYHANGPLGVGGLRLTQAWGNNDDSGRAEFKQWHGEAGWPMPALSWTLRANDTTWIHKEKYIEREQSWVDLGIPIAPHRVRPWKKEWQLLRLPIRPLLLGFAVNTMVFAAPLFVLLLLLRAGKLRPSLRSVLLAVVGGTALSLAIALVCWGVWIQRGTPFTQRSFGMAAAEYVEEQHLDWPARVPETFPDSPAWIGFNGESFGVRSYEYTATSVAGAAILWMHVTWSMDAFSDGREVELVRCGWPLAVLESAEVFADETPYARPDPNRPAAIPYRIEPLGLAISATMYASALWTLWAVPLAFRRWRRLRRGSCLTCGYELADLARCPECGTDAPASFFNRPTPPTPPCSAPA